MSVVFAIGYAGIVLEDLIGSDKAAVSLMMAVTLWTVASTAQLRGPGRGSSRAYLAET